MTETTDLIQRSLTNEIKRLEEELYLTRAFLRSCAGYVQYNQDKKQAILKDEVSAYFRERNLS